MKRHKHRKGWSRLRRPRQETETTRQYTEQEILSLSRSPSNAAGIIRPETGDLHVPAGFVETGDGQQTNRLPRVILVIITLALIFIALITYFVTDKCPQRIRCFGCLHRDISMAKSSALKTTIVLATLQVIALAHTPLVPAG